MSSTHVEPLEEAAATTPGRKKRMAPSKRHNLTGWIFLIPAALLILITSFWPMIQAFLLSLQTGNGTRLNWAEPLWYNYARLFQDATFRLTLGSGAFSLRLPADRLPASTTASSTCIASKRSM